MPISALLNVDQLQTKPRVKENRCSKRRPETNRVTHQLSAIAGLAIKAASDCVVSVVWDLLRFARYCPRR